MKRATLIILTLLLSVSLHAETAKSEKSEKSDEKDGKVIEAAKSISGETKRLLRRVGRKSMDETCELKNSKAECDKQKAEHAALNKKEEIEGVEGN